MRRWARILAALLVLVPWPVAAHENHPSWDGLSAGGEARMVADYRGAQPGPLIVVPFVDEPLDCAVGRAPDYVVAAVGGWAVSLVANATHVRAEIHAAADGYVAWAVDSNDAVRALIMMEEVGIAVHALLALAHDPGGPAAAPALYRGELGIPFDLPGASSTELGHGATGDEIHLAHDGLALPNVACGGPTPDSTVVFVVRRDLVKAALLPGRIGHIIFLHDPTVGELLPRPLDSTHVFQFNAYWARPGEDAASIRAAIEGRAGADTWLPLAALGVALLAVFRPRPRA